MEELELFSTIDKVSKIFEENLPIYEKISEELSEDLKKVLCDDYIIAMHTRIKNIDSLKAKIIQHNLYLNYNSPKDIINNCSDLIGIKVECRFNDDEALLYKKLFDIFKKQNKNGYYYSEEFPNVFIDLVSYQPQIQRNGLPIYRIDGYYQYKSTQISFELQIKSLVHSFWGDIEHRLVYKNTHYCIYNDFISGMLLMVNDNLNIIDSQLKRIYLELNSEEHNVQEIIDNKSMSLMISKALNDLFVNKMKKSLGFSLDLKETTDIIAEFVLNKGLKDDINDSLIDLLYVLRRLVNIDINFKEKLVIDIDLNGQDDFTVILGNYLKVQINKDYSWYIFFKILCSIEPADDNGDFLLFLHILKQKLFDYEFFKAQFTMIDDNDLKLLSNGILGMLAEVIIEIGNIEIIKNSNLLIIRKALNNTMLKIAYNIRSFNDFKIWRHTYIVELRKELKQFLNNNKNML